MHQVKVKLYQKSFRDEIETFRKKTFDEGNDALPIEKYNPDTIIGETFMAYVDGELASIAVLEEDHYVTESNQVVRACRLHTLKKFRNMNLAAKYLLPEMVTYALQNGYRTIYWTHDVSKKAINAIYQGKRTPLNDRAAYKTSFWKSIKFDRTWLFQVDPKSDMLQYVYYIGEQLKPKKNYVWMKHGN